MDKKIILFFTAILILSITLRFLPLFGKTEVQNSQVLMTFLTMKVYAENNLQQVLIPLSGAQHNGHFQESPGLVYLGAIPYYLLGWAIGFENSIYLVKIIFSIASLMIVYFLALKISGNQVTGLFASIMAAIMPIGIYAEEVTSWTGDSFVPILIFGSVLILLYSMDFIENKQSRLKGIFLLIVSLGLAIFAYSIWNGGTYAPFCWLIGLSVILLCKYVKIFKNRLAIILIVIIILWLAYIKLPEISPGIVNFFLIPPNAQNIVQTITQSYPWLFGPCISVCNAIDHNLPYLIWHVFGFISFMFLLIIGLFKFKNKNTKEWLVVLTLLVVAIPLVNSSTRWESLIYIPFAILAGIGLNEIKNDTNKKMIVMIISIMLIFTLIQIIYAQPPPEVLPQLKTASLWISNNTAINSTFLTYYPDGPDIEFWGNRTSISDTLQEFQNTSLVPQFSSFLYQPAENFSYLLLTKPDYLVVENYWIQSSYVEDQATLAGLPRDTSANGTNLQFLEEGQQSINSSMLSLERVYDANGTIIYKIFYSNR